MKIRVLLLAGVVFFLGAVSAQAILVAPLGPSYAAVKIDSVHFTDSFAEDLGVETALYLGIEAYVETTPDLYFGGEFGYANPDGSEGGVDTEITFIPFEVNLKFAKEVAPRVVLDLGGGLSQIYVDQKITIGASSDSKDDWLFGGQIFFDFNYVLEKMFVGFHGKYQFTGEFTGQDNDYINWRVGGSFGLTF